MTKLCWYVLTMNIKNFIKNNGLFVHLNFDMKISNKRSYYQYQHT